MTPDLLTATSELEKLLAAYETINAVHHSESSLQFERSKRLIELRDQMKEPLMAIGTVFQSSGWKVYLHEGEVNVRRGRM